MLYITGIHALNLPCSLETCGDWHTSALHWENISNKMVESNNSIFGDYGLEDCNCVPENPGNYKVANTIRALLDLLVQGNYGVAQGMKDDFICNDKYTPEVFSLVSKLVNQPNWKEIDAFMGKEYKMQWLHYKEDNLGIHSTKTVTPANNRSLTVTVNDDNVAETTLSTILSISQRDKIRDLYDIIFICKNYWDAIPNMMKMQLATVLSYKGMDYFDYLISTQSDELIDNNKLSSDFLDLWDALGLLQ